MEPVLYEEDIQEIETALIFLVSNRNIPRVDISLAEGKDATIYWAGTVLRLDIKGLK